MASKIEKKRRFECKAAELFKLYLYIGVLMFLIIETPNRIWDGDLGKVTIALGALAVWRYSWWMTHVVRAIIYARMRYPGIKRRAERLWDSGWRPSRVFFMMTTFLEHPETCEKVLLSISREIESTGIKGP